MIDPALPRADALAGAKQCFRQMCDCLSMEALQHMSLSLALSDDAPATLRWLGRIDGTEGQVIAQAITAAASLKIAEECERRVQEQHTTEETTT